MRSLTLASLLVSSFAATAQPLPTLYRTALANDPAVTAAQAQIRVAEARLAQAWSAFGPTAALVYNQTSSRADEAPTYDRRSFGGKELAVQLTQPLIRLPLHSALDAAKAQVELQRSSLEQARLESMQRLVEAAFEVLKARDAVTYAQAQSAATGEQLASARRTFSVGRAPVTDVREAEAKADTVAAQLSAARFDLELRQQILAELVGGPAAGLVERALAESSLPVVEGSTIGDWVGSAFAVSPQVQQALRALEISEFEVVRADRAHAPTVDLTSSYGASSDTGTATTFLPRRAKTGQIGVNVNIPLFASGATQARVREAVAARDKAQADLDAARRTTSLAVRQEFTATRSAVSQARGLEAAVQSSEVALRANRRGYEVGMKVNFEVLESQTRLFEARRDLSKARYDAWLHYVRLSAAAGLLAEADLERLDAMLVVDRSPILQERRPPPEVPR
jgi:outer membrane protein